MWPFEEAVINLPNLLPLCYKNELCKRYKLLIWKCFWCFWILPCYIRNQMDKDFRRLVTFIYFLVNNRYRLQTAYCDKSMSSKQRYCPSLPVQYHFAKERPHISQYRLSKFFIICPDMVTKQKTNTNIDNPFFIIYRFQCCKMPV